jgi:hypothetical protein
MYLAGLSSGKADAQTITLRHEAHKVC